MRLSLVLCAVLLVGAPSFVVAESAVVDAGSNAAVVGAAKVSFSKGFPTPLDVDAAVLASLPPSHVEADDHGTRGKWTGVDFHALIARAGAPAGDTLRGDALSKFVLVTAADNYRVLFSLGELDAVFGGEKITLAYLRDGEALSAQEGPFRLIVPGDTKQARWVRQVVSVELLDAADGLPPRVKGAHGH